MLSFADFFTPVVRNVPADYPTIQSAIDASSDGDEIIVSPGTYKENIHFKGKNIILRSTDPTSPTVVASTIIDGNKAGSVVTFSGSELTTCVLSGFTITNGYAEYGGGIYSAIYDNCKFTQATIQNNIITGNIATDLGGGIYRCNGIIQNNAISGNSARCGGGLRNCDGIIQNNTISGNSVSEKGGGLEDCNGTILNNFIYRNSAVYGGGLCNCNGIIQNNTIWHNIATNSGGGLNDCNGIIQNCIIWRNEAPGYGPQLYDSDQPTYSCIQDWTEGGTGNISLNPQLLDPENGDFHLLPDSPCIDAECFIGDLITDYEGDQRGYVGISELQGDSSDYDIGADEYLGVVPTPAPTPTPCIIYVPDDYPTIQAAIDAAVDGCEIIVSPGTYVENINFKGKDIILRSTEPENSEVVASTIIDGNQAGSVVTLTGRDSAFSSLSGFTITNGKSTFGGGINADGALTTINHNIISFNIAIRGGGISSSNGIIHNNIISDNYSEQSGGIDISNGIIQNNIIYNNSAGFGGRISWAGASSRTIPSGIT